MLLTHHAFSRRRWLLLASACALAYAGGANARPLVPEKPSVEINLNALRDLQPMGRYAPAPAPVAVPAPAYMPPPAPTPGYMPPPAPLAPLGYSPAGSTAPVTRQVPVEQYGTPKAVPKPAPRPAPKPQPKSVAPASSLPPPPAPKAASVPTPAPKAVAPKPVVPAPKPAPKVEVPKPTPTPAPMAVAPVDLPPIPSLPPVEPTPAPATKPAPKVEAPKPAAPALPPPPVSMPKVEAPKPAAAPAAPVGLPSLPPMAVEAPVELAPETIPLPKVEAPKPAPKMQAPKPAPKAAVPKPVPAPKSQAAPVMPDLPPLPATIPDNAVIVPKVDQIRQPAKPPAPDISGLDFGKLPVPMAAPKPLAQPSAKEQTPSLAPVIPNQVSAPSLPSEPPMDIAPLMVPVKKDLPPLPPTVTDRLDALGSPGEPKKEGIVSDTTVIRGPTAEELAKRNAETDAKLKAQAEAAKKTADEKARLQAEQKVKAKAEADAAKAAAEAKLKAETEAAAAKAAAEAKAKADAEAAKKAATKLPPASLPSPPAIAKAEPDPLAKPNAPVKLEKSEIGALPKLDSKTNAPAAVPSLPSLPKAPKPGLPELPTLVVPGTKAPEPLPSLSAITGEAPPSSMDILQPQDGVSSSPLDNVPPAPALPSLPSLPVPAGGDSDLPTVRRELPEIDVSAKATTPAAAKPPALPPVKPPIALPPKAEAAATKELPPALPSTPVQIPVLPAAKSETPIAVASAPATGGTGELETTLTFSKKNSALDENAKKSLTAIAEKARKSQRKIRVVGYASGTVEESADARKISLARGNMIRAFLLGKGVSDSMLHVQALGNQVSSDKADIFLQ